MQEGITFIQLGTNDAHHGKYQKNKDGTPKGDPCFEFLKDKKIKKGILVEPLDFLNDKILEIYSSKDNVTIENVVISSEEKDKEVDFYYPKQWEKIKGSSRHSSANEKWPPLMSNNKSNQKEVVSKKIKSMTIMNLFEKHNITDLDYLFVDVEGFDNDILMSIDFDKVNINRIQWETYHGSQAKSFLTKNGYTIGSFDFFDSVATKEKRE